LIGFLFANSSIRGFVYKSFVIFNLQFARLQIAQSNLPIKIAIFWDNIAMLLAREHVMIQATLTLYRIGRGRGTGGSNVPPTFFKSKKNALFSGIKCSIYRTKKVFLE
jgi:hypothetical protein